MSPSKKSSKKANTAVVYHPLFLEHDTGQGHPESPQRLTSIMNYLDAQQLWKNPQIVKIQPQPASPETVKNLHHEGYIKRVKETAQRGGGWVDADTHISVRSYDAALLAAGAGLTAAKAIISKQVNNAFCLVRPPGHHALATRAMGFCLFNNIALTADWLLRNKHANRVAIVDWDAHHGNGTQDLFFDRKDVLYISLHQDGRTLFPLSGFPDEVGEGDGKAYTINLPVPPGTPNEPYLKIYEEIAEPILHQFKPDWILISAGYDAHRNDPLTQLGLTNKAFHQITHSLLSIAKKTAHNRIIAFLEGGYNLQATSKSTYLTLHSLAQLEGKPPIDPPYQTKTSPQYTSYTKKLTKFHSDHLGGEWKL
jgi:acetoin utilization deacetylase AcuC-like enzyme